MSKKLSKHSKDKLPQSKTDWARVDALTDADIRKATTDDPDWRYDTDIDWSEADFVVPPRKEAISIRLDGDVLEYLRGEGTGYQSRINAILRHYVDARKKSKPPSKAVVRKRRA